jgi:preprotein translocase subunit SecD
MVLKSPVWLLSSMFAACLLLSIGCSQGAPGNPRSEADALFSLHWLVEEPAPDVRTCELLATGEEVGVVTPPILSLPQFDSATVESEGDDYVYVAVWISAEAQGILETATRENVGRRIGIVFRNQVVATPLIRGELRLDAFPIYEISAEHALELAAQLNDALMRMSDSNSLPQEPPSNLPSSGGG